MVLRWPHAASNVCSPRPKEAPRTADERGHAAHAAGVFRSDAGAQIGTHRVGVHTEPHPCQAPLANHLHQDGIWPALRGPQDQRAPGYDPAGLSAFGTALRPRPYRYMHDNYRLLPFAPRLNAATATRSDHAARAEPARADSSRARDRHIAWPDPLSPSPHASTSRDPAAARSPLRDPALHPASSLAPASERLRAALESSLTDTADERAGRSWTADCGDGARSSLASRGCAATASARTPLHVNARTTLGVSPVARVSWDDSSPRDARDSLASCASEQARQAVDASLAAARAVYDRERCTPLRVALSPSLAYGGSRRSGLGDGGEVDAHLSRASQFFTSTLGDSSPQPHARATRRCGNVYPHDSPGGSASPNPRRVAWIDMAASPSRAWPVFATEPARYGDSEDGEEGGDWGGEGAGWGLGGDYEGGGAALPGHTARESAARGWGWYCGPTDDPLAGTVEWDNAVGADVQAGCSVGFIPHLERQLSASHGHAMAALRSRQRQALMRLAPPIRRPAAAAAKAAGQSAQAEAAAARVTAAERELAEAVAEAGYWCGPEAVPAASSADIGAGHASSDAEPSPARAPAVPGLGAGMRWASLDATLSASLSLSSIADGPPPCLPPTPATDVSAAAAEAARALAARDAQALRDRPRLWVPPSPLCCSPQGGEADVAHDVRSAAAPRRAMFEVDAAPAPNLPSEGTPPPPVTTPGREAAFSAINGARPALVRAQSDLCHQDLVKHRMLPHDMTKPPSGAAPLARGMSADCPSGSKSPYKRGCREAVQVTPVHRTVSGESSSSAGAGGGAGSPDWPLPQSPYKRGTRAATPAPTPIAPRSNTPSIETMARAMATESELLQSLRKLHRQFEDSLADLRV